MRNRDFPVFLLYALGFFLLWEWLRPIEQLTDTGHVGVFIVFLLIAFSMSFFRLKWIWQWPLKMIYILYSINHLHYQASFMEFSWLKAFIGDVVKNIRMLFTGDWNNLSSEFRTLLFFLLLWVMVYLIQYWMLNRQRIFLFFFMTLIYITVLDAFTPYSATFAIVRTVVSGFVVMGMLTFYRMILKEKVSRVFAPTGKWMIPLAIMIAFSVLVGISAPKAGPILPDPVPYLKGDHKYGARAGGTKTIGYGLDDTHLGGPFIGDSKIVYLIESTEQNYWKVETKDLYTGKGWIASGSTPIQFKLPEFVPVLSFFNTVDSFHETAQVTAASQAKYPFIIYPAGIQKILKINPNYGDNNIFEIDTTKEKITADDDKQQPIAPKQYSIDFKVPKYNATALRKTKKFDSSTMSAEFYQQYTQLPKGLPSNIKQLTEKITAKETNWFDKAKAVEDYLGGPDFTYDQKNVAYPSGKEDYVAQFLFDTKRGYCDNFSSSMAIMLRSIGIPTRWIKGYTGGDFLRYSDADSSKSIYEITNNNAHSWVEVFFPNQGWVPFEPTKGFYLNVNINYFSNSTTPKNNQQSTPVPVKKPLKKPLAENAQSPVINKLDHKPIWGNIVSLLKENWGRIVFILLGLAGVFGIFYRIRGKWYPYYLLMRYKFTKKDANIVRTYPILLHQLDRFGLKRKENQTLRNYARYVDTFFSSREMTRLTACYEKYLYQQNLPKGTWEDTRELWENLIKKTIA